MTYGTHGRYAPIKKQPFTGERPPRVLICGVQIPFITGGAESHIESLRLQLLNRGFEVDVVRLPLKWYPPRQIVSDAIAWRFLDLTHSYGLPVDLVIATRFPSYAVRHPRKIAWVFHQHRQVYDLLTTELTDFKDRPDDDHVRKLIYQMDRRSLLECRHRFANSRNVARRMQKYLGIDSEPLYHPPPLAGRYRCAEYGDYVLSVGRLEVNKRVDLLIRSLVHTRHPVKAVIVGKGPQNDHLRSLAAEFGLTDRIDFRGFVDDRTLLDLYSRCGIVYYAPLDEDYGYVTLEAFLSGKAVLAAADSGGVLEFVGDGRTGYVLDPVPERFSAGIDHWYESADRGRIMGETGREIAGDINWDNVIGRLTSILDADRESG
ncbi:glycosyltransferase family 4 protein [bacterium]|nr:glycosyltransferase family 4 protein [candidate division CSSED10-310 bacterium]